MQARTIKAAGSVSNAADTVTSFGGSDDAPTKADIADAADEHEGQVQ